MGHISPRPGPPRAEASDRPGWQVHKLASTNSFGLYEVRVSGLRFVIEYSPSYGVAVREVPRPFRVRERGDLVETLETLAMAPEDSTRALVAVVAKCVLPHINSTDAAMTYIMWSRRFSGPPTWAKWPPPVPADATVPPAWIHRLADAPILSTLTAWASRVQCGQPPESLYVLDLLGACDSPKATRVLDSMFQRHVECRAHFMDLIVHGGLPILDATWDLLMRELPTLHRLPALTTGFQPVNILWFDIARRRRWPTAAERRLHLQSLGARFVHDIVRHPYADSLLCSAGNSGRVDPLGAMDSYAGDGLGVFLQVCRTFGRASDVPELRGLLGRFEVLLRDTSLAQQWDGNRAKWLGDRTDLLESFTLDRDSTLAVVAGRR